MDGHTVPSTLLPCWSRRALREVIGNHKQGYLYKDPNQPRTYCHTGSIQNKNDHNTIHLNYSNSLYLYPLDFGPAEICLLCTYVWSLAALKNSEAAARISHATQQLS